MRRSGLGRSIKPSTLKGDGGALLARDLQKNTSKSKKKTAEVRRSGLGGPIVPNTKNGDDGALFARDLTKETAKL